MAPSRRNPADAVKDADLVILCSPVGSYKELAAAIAPHLKPGAILSDVGSVKSAVIRDVAPFCARRACISFPPIPSPAPSSRAPMPASPACSIDRWCIITPLPGADAEALAKLKDSGKPAAARSK